MYKNFTEYWNEKKEMYQQLGVSEAVAKTIWNDAISSLGWALIEDAKNGKLI